MPSQSCFISCVVTSFLPKDFLHSQSSILKSTVWSGNRTSYVIKSYSVIFHGQKLHPVMFAFIPTRKYMGVRCFKEQCLMYFLSIVPVSSKIVAVDGKMTRLIGYFSNCCQNVTALFLCVNYLDLEPILKNIKGPVTAS